jgi:antitoxin (DNA-binding transcriptional repressor) of toxin-antitoxin stability system
MEMTAANFAKTPKAALDAARDGEEVFITEGGITVARLGPATGASLMERLHRDGLLTPPAEDRAVPRLPQAEGAKDALSSLLGRLKR